MNLLKQKMALYILKEQLRQEKEEKIRKEMDVMIQNRLLGLNSAKKMNDSKAEVSRETQFNVILKYSNFLIIFINKTKH